MFLCCAIGHSFNSEVVSIVESGTPKSGMNSSTSKHITTQPLTKQDQPSTARALKEILRFHLIDFSFLSYADTRRHSL